MIEIFSHAFCMISKLLLFTGQIPPPKIRLPILFTLIYLGPGLAFLVNPEVVLQLTPSALWSICFFLMLLALGVDSQFCILESLIVGLVDNWPKYLRPRRLQFTAVMCIFMLILGIPMITQVLKTRAYTH